jgi:ankyrin repeat protein
MSAPLKKITFKRPSSAGASRSKVATGIDVHAMEEAVLKAAKEQSGAEINQNAVITTTMAAPALSAPSSSTSEQTDNRHSFVTQSAEGPEPTSIPSDRKPDSNGYHAEGLCNVKHAEGEACPAEQMLQLRRQENLAQQAKANSEMQRLLNDKSLVGQLLRIAQMSANLFQDREEFKRRLETGESPNQLDEQGEHSVLHHCAYRSMLLEAEQLIAAGANVDIVNFRGETPLMWAVKIDNLKMIILLLNAGANVFAKDHCGMTAIHHAAEKGHTLNMDLLMIRGADVNVLVRNEKETQALI